MAEIVYKTSDKAKRHVGNNQDYWLPIIAGLVKIEFEDYNKMGPEGRDQLIEAVKLKEKFDRIKREELAQLIASNTRI